MGPAAGFGCSKHFPPPPPPAREDPSRTVHRPPRPDHLARPDPIPLPQAGPFAFDACPLPCCACAGYLVWCSPPCHWPLESASACWWVAWQRTCMPVHACCALCTTPSRNWPARLSTPADIPPAFPARMIRLPWRCLLASPSPRAQSPPGGSGFTGSTPWHTPSGARRASHPPAVTAGSRLPAPIRQAPPVMQHQMPANQHCMAAPHWHTPADQRRPNTLSCQAAGVCGGCRALAINEFTQERWMQAPAAPPSSGQAAGASQEGLGPSILLLFELPTSRSWIWVGGGRCCQQ